MIQIKHPLRISKQLTSAISHGVFALVIIATTSDALIRTADIGQGLGLGVLLLAYTLGGMVGWRGLKHSPRRRRLYYAGMSVLGGGIVTAVTLLTQHLVGGMLALLPLAFHGLLLGLPARLLFMIGLLAWAAIYTLITPLTPQTLLVFWAVVSSVLTLELIGQILTCEEDVNLQLTRYASQVEDLSIMRERSRIAREIHDNLGHYLTAIHIQAQAAQAVLASHPTKAGDALQHIQSLAHNGLQEVRRSVAAVRQYPERRPLSEAIEALLEESRATGLSIDCAFEGDWPRLPTEIEITLCRIVQEALTNIHKHAQATQACIRFVYHKHTGVIQIRVQDNGRGISTPHQAGFGLIGVRERVNLLGGTFHVHNVPSGGLALEVSIKPWKTSSKS